MEPILDFHAIILTKHNCPDKKTRPWLAGLYSWQEQNAPFRTLAEGTQSLELRTPMNCNRN